MSHRASAYTLEMYICPIFPDSPHFQAYSNAHLPSSESSTPGLVSGYPKKSPYIPESLCNHLQGLTPLPMSVSPSSCLLFVIYANKKVLDKIQFCQGRNIRGATLFHKKKILCSYGNTIISPATNVCERHRILRESSPLTMPSVVHLLHCVRPGSQPPGFSVRARYNVISTS